MSSSPADLVPRPARGRVFEGSRRVRLGDVSPAGRLRLDAAARYLQDLSADDTADAALPDAEAWVVRRTVLEVRQFPRYLEPLELATWCSGTGSRWAERRVSMTGRDGAQVDGTSLWVHLDMDSGRPTRIPDGFEEIYGEARQGRTVTARLHHPDPPPGLGGQPWHLRFTDFDVLEHVNNAAYWEAVEEVLASRRDLRAPLRAEVEHRVAVERGADVQLRTADGEEGGLDLWLVADGTVAATAQVRPL